MNNDSYKLRLDIMDGNPTIVEFKSLNSTVIISIAICNDQEQPIQKLWLDGKKPIKYLTQGKTETNPVLLEAMKTIGTFDYYLNIKLNLNENKITPRVLIKLNADVFK